MRRRAAAIGVLLCLVAPWSTTSAQTDEQLWTLLKSGGQVILMRHAITTPGAGDPAGMRLDDCSTQRNLTDEGRQHARRIGDAFRARGVNLGPVLASPWCRCIETARLAFGKAEAWQPLANLFGRSGNEDKQVAELRAFVSQTRQANVALVSHGSTIVALTGVSLGTGEMVIVTPKGSGEFAVIGRLAVPPS